MANIYETKTFIVESHEKPFVPREEGGDIRIRVKDRNITDRTKLTASQAIELMRLTMIVGEALETAMNSRGIKVVKINYQDMGNWAYKRGEKPYLHVFVLGRVLGAKHQPYPESVYLPDRSTGFYDTFEPLNDDDMVEILKEIERISGTEKYVKFQGLIDGNKE